MLLAMDQEKNDKWSPEQQKPVTGACSQIHRTFINKVKVYLLMCLKFFQHLADNPEEWEDITFTGNEINSQGVRCVWKKLSNKLSKLYSQYDVMTEFEFEYLRKCYKHESRKAQLTKKLYKEQFLNIITRGEFPAAWKILTELEHKINYTRSEGYVIRIINNLVSNI